MLWLSDMGHPAGSVKNPIIAKQSYELIWHIWLKVYSSLLQTYNSGKKDAPRKLTSWTWNCSEFIRPPIILFITLLCSPKKTQSAWYFYKMNMENLSIFSNIFWALNCLTKKQNDLHSAAQIFHMTMSCKESLLMQS